MTGEKKLSKEELNSIQELKQRNQQLLIEYGKLELSRKQLQQTEKELDKQYQQVKAMEEDLLNNLRSKYQNGSIDLDRGVFKPAEDKDTPVTAFDE